MQLRIPLGTYGSDLADIVVEKFNAERNRHKERSPHRLNAYILRRGRGNRQLYKRVGDKFELIANGQRLPLKYAQRQALYLVIDLKKELVKNIWYVKRTLGL